MTQTVAKACTMMITTATLMQISTFTLCVQPLPVSYPDLGIIESGGYGRYNDHTDINLSHTEI